MSLHPNFVEAVMHLHPEADFRTAPIIRDDGEGPYLVQWGLPGNPPTEQEIEAAVLALPEAALAKKRLAASAVVDDDVTMGRVQRAVCMLLVDELNALRGWLMIFKAEVAAATTLADLKTRVAGLPSLPDRTKNQAVAAIKAAILLE